MGKRKRQKDRQKKRREKKRESNKIGDQVLRIYNRVCATLIENTRDDTTESVFFGVSEEKEAQKVWSFLWARMREARIFVIPNEQIEASVLKAGEKIMEIFGYEGFNDYADLILGDSFAETNDMIIELSNRVEPPSVDRWPFPTMWIAPRDPVAINKTLLKTGISSAVRNTLGSPQGSILGMLYTTDHLNRPYITQAALLSSKESDALSALVWPTIYKPDAGWMHPADLSPWTCQMILSFINSFGSVEERSPSSTIRNERDKKTKQLAVPLPIPKPYYVVKLKKSTVRCDEERGAPQKSWELTFQHDVRGHDRVFVERGPLPMREEIRDKLIKRGYRIYVDRPLKSYDKKRLLQRNHPLPRRDEWVALLVIWVKSFRKGPPDAPYVPSIRVVS